MPEVKGISKALYVQLIGNQPKGSFRMELQTRENFVNPVGRTGANGHLAVIERLSCYSKFLLLNFHFISNFFLI